MPAVGLTESVESTRRRRMEIGGERLTQLLQEWAEWLHRYYAPVTPTAPLPDSGTVYETPSLARTVRAGHEHGDPVLNEMLATERQGLRGAAAVQRLVRDMPMVWQGCLLGNALGYTQAQIADEVGIKQQRVSEIVMRARFLLSQWLVNAAPVVVGRRG